MPDFFLGWENYGLPGLFLVCFLAATILPLSSEIVFLFFLSSGTYSPIEIWLAASAGNCLGGFTNYLLGFVGNRLFKPKPESKALLFARKYGFLAAFFSWLPFIGDPMLVALGYLRSPFWRTMLLMCAGKILRYSVFLMI
ncbi:MAG: rane protein [Crocinitomicaceae bacterium]|jgi:membrane protein YqaA with SNARE-associated domain|nr:rane protein [Crocinitomicaceae bacterium]